MVSLQCAVVMDYASTSTAGPSTSSPQHDLSPRVALSKRTSSRNALRDTFRHAQDSGSPPTTPHPHRRQTKRKEKAKQPLRSRASEPVIAGEIYRANKRHSHGLSWTSTTRDSVVDNLLFSLDNLSRGDSDEEDEKFLDPDFDKTKYVFPQTLVMSRPALRARGNTQSTSSLSDYDRLALSDSLEDLSPPRKGRRSNSSSTFGIHHTMGSKMRPASRVFGMGRVSSDTQKPTGGGALTEKNLRKKDSREYFGYGDLISTSYDVRKPTANGAPLSRPGTKRESSNQYGYGDLVSAQRPARGRRSLSMDQMYASPVVNGDSVINRGRPVPADLVKFEDDPDAAPEPMIAAGPRKKQNPTSTGPVYVNQAPSKASLRKKETQTDLRSADQPQSSAPIPQNVRNQASDFVRGTPAASSAHLQDHSKALLSPTMLSPPGSSGPHSSQRERPGFFKRMFGSSSSATRKQSMEYGDMASAPVRTSSSGGSHSRTGTRQASKEQPTGTPYQPPPLTKKPSSFFRRRKKSTSDYPLPPPLPPALNGSNMKAEPSPSISSLRKVMDPYLAHENLVANGVPTPGRNQSSRPVTSESTTEDSDNLELFHSGYTPPADASLGQRNPMTRSPSMKPKFSAEQEDPKTTKLKVKKRKPEMLAPTNGQFLGDRSFLLDASSVEPSNLSPPAVSPISVLPPNDKENHRPVSRASTGDRILGSDISPARSDSEALARNLSVDSTISNDRSDEGWVRPSDDRPSTGKSDRLFLRPSPSDEDGPDFVSSPTQLEPAAESARDESNPGSVTSPAFVTATSATFPVAVHSPTSPASRYHSATSLPLPSVQIDGNEPKKSIEANGMNLPSHMVHEGDEYHERARKIYEGDEEDVIKSEAASWLGETNTLSRKTLEAYMQLFDFAGINMLSALRVLCGKLVLKGETQQFDRIITALSARWCQCNPKHGFKAQDVVHTVFYSIILLNTDLHLADIGEKMSRNAYVKNTLPTIKRVAQDAAPYAFDETVKPTTNKSRPTLPFRNDSSNSIPPTSPSFPPSSPNEHASFDHEQPPPSKRLSMRPMFDRKDSDGVAPDAAASGSALNALVNHPWSGSERGWEFEIETILKSFFASIRNDPLPLHGAPVTELPSTERSMTLTSFGGLKRSGSVVSKAPSDNTSYRSRPGLKSMTMGFRGNHNRSRPKLYPASTLGSSRTSFDDGNSVWSPAQSSNWSKYSLSKTLTSASMQSLGQHLSPTASDYKHSIGFANALSQAMIREESLGSGGADSESVSMSVPGGLLEDEALALEGAPWAKEGLVKHKHHLDAPGKKARERNWGDVFAVISKGKLTLFAFNTSTKSTSMGRKMLTKQPPGSRAGSITAMRVGGGDWMENAEQLGVFVLRHTIASTLPPPGYSKTRPYVWALSLPSGAVHLFQVGTPAIAVEFMTTANYWSARLSKEPLSGGVSNIEYGWSDQVINTALVEQRLGTSSPTPPPGQTGHIRTTSGGMGRPSFQSSVRGSFDTGFGGRARLPGDKTQLADWHQPTQSMMASQLMEVDQLKALTAYVTNVESDLARHNELKHAIELAVRIEIFWSWTAIC